ncbi:MAG: allantoinase AllB [Verrucomicrobiota bacterium]|nr:allantoinase AllB [Verrucomicrobiota bacterium]
MSDFDLIVRGAIDLGIAGGKFVAIGPNLAGSAREEIDATGLELLPGVIDAHVHFNEPGRADWEGFATGSRSAAAGGITTFFDMPLNAHPPTIDGPSFDQKRAAAESSSLVDFAFWGGMVPGNRDQFEILPDRGVVGLKAFMADSGIDDFPCVNEAQLRAGMNRAAELGMIVAVHAESNAITQKLTREKIAQGKTAVRDFLDSRPISAELDAIGVAIDLAAETGCSLHVVHVSCGSGVELISRARAQGIDVTCETCPHYLVLSDADMEQLGAVAKCAPPLRSVADQHALRERLADITTIGSDHSPCPWPMKDRANFFEAWGGISGCQHLLPLLLDFATPELVAQLTSERVANRFRLPQKGGIALGKDADFTLVDSRGNYIVTSDSLHYRHRHSPYIGRRLKARVAQTVLRGQTVFRDGKFVASPAGKLIRPGTL